MSPGWRSGQRIKLAIVVVGVLVAAEGTRSLRADEPGLLGRIFRFGQPADRGREPASNTPRSGARGRPGPEPGGSAAPIRLGDPSAGDVGRTASTPPPVLGPGAEGPSFSAAPPPSSFSSPFPPPGANPSDAPPIRPQPRQTRAVTEADPILTRVALGRTNDGNRFGMFMQVYADGTVIDGEGVHRLKAEDLRTLVQALQSPELARAQGHCGSPPTDFVEDAYVVIYDRKMGGLRANAFSYSGNPNGCDPAIRQLHAAIEAVQARVSSPTTVASTTPSTTTPMPPITLPDGGSLGAAPPPPEIQPERTDVPALIPGTTSTP